MKLTTIISSIILFCAVTQVYSQPQIGDFGFGLILGEPTGLTLKGSAGRENAWDLALGSSWFGSLRIHGDYLWNVNAFSSRKAGLYFGLGAALGFGRGKGVVFKGKKGEWYYYEDEEAMAFGIRGVAGVNGMPFKAPVELFLEVAPLIGITPATGVGTDLAVGIRYYP
ncbi:MAG: hypothetical protein KDD67_18595 [Ignavibacteriae bacterium]|nr:hypothetical protein [Ignavibacteriota bacterium]MCB9214474.1 hypothetical protein [Ignavibacteria bacterium]